VRLRILMVTDSYPPLIGGATRDTQLLSKELVRRGYAVDVATVGQPGLPAEEDDAGVRVHRIEGLTARFSSDPHRRHHPPVPDPATVWKVHRLIANVQPDIVHSYGWITYSCAAALLRIPIPLLVSIRDYSNICAIRTFMHQESRGEEICSGPAPRKCVVCAERYYDSVPKTMASVGGVFSGQALLRYRVQGFHYCSAYVQGIIRRDLLAGRGVNRYAAGRPLVERVIPGFAMIASMAHRMKRSCAACRPSHLSSSSAPYV
jgi:glycosyltransferase involved in cell wall biosynthesis